MEQRRIVVTGLGVISPIGNGIDQFWNALLAGKSGVSHLSAFDPSCFSCQIAAEVKDFNPKEFMSDKDARRLDRFVQFGLGASKMSILDSGLALDKIVHRSCGCQQMKSSQPVHFIKGHQTLGCVFFILPNLCSQFVG